MEHAAEAQRGQAVGRSSCGSQLCPVGRSTEMISDRRPDTYRKVLVERVGENLLPTAQAWGLRWSCLPVAAPSAGNGHIDLTCHLIPGQPLVAQLPDLFCGGGM